MRGFQAEGAAPLVTGEPVPDPETKATAIRIGNPASWKLAEAAADESGGRFRAVTDAADPGRAGRARPARRRLRRAGVGRRRRRAARRPRRRVTSYAGLTVVVTVTGHGLKDIETALESAGDLVDTVIDADVEQRRRAGGRAPVTFVAGPVAGRRSRRPAPTSAPASTASASRSSCATTSTAEVGGDRPGGRGDRRGRRRACRATRPTSSSGRWARRSARWGDDAAGLRLHVHQPHPARPRARLVVGGDRRRDRPGAGAGRPAGPTGSTTARLLALANAARGPPRQRRARRCSAGSSSAARTTRTCGPTRRRVDPRDPAPSSSCRRPALSTEVARGLLPATVPHADAAANAGRAALLVAALGGAPDAAAPRRPRTSCTRPYRRPAMPESLALVDRLRADGHAAVVSGAGPTVLVLTADGDLDPVTAYCPDGWRCPRSTSPRGRGRRRLTRRDGAREPRLPWPARLSDRRCLGSRAVCARRYVGSGRRQGPVP